jgi:hypothetical protein
MTARSGYYREGGLNLCERLLDLVVVDEDVQVDIRPLIEGAFRRGTPLPHRVDEGGFSQ